MKYKYYEKLDIVRLLAMIAVLLFHLNILKGGFLAVCIFFVLSGYLSAISSFKKKKFSIKEYYLHKLKNLYLPLVIIVFLTIAVVSLIPSISWINLKPETTSVLGGFNNFWQLKANQDYFTRSVNSPFTHFWFMAILIQFDLVYPFVYLFLRKVTDKVNRIVPLIILSGLSIISGIYFYISFKSNNLMFVYYNTFTRLFSLIWGLWLGYVIISFNHLIPKLLRNKIVSNIIFYIYLIILIVMFFLIGSDYKYLPLMLLLSSLITVRIIDYSTLETVKPNKVLKYLASISYEVYLIQYPIIFILSKYDMNNILRISLSIGLTFLLSMIIKFALNKADGVKKVFRYILLGLIVICCVFGLYKFVRANDYTKEMDELQEQLNQNELLAKKKQEEYIHRMERVNANKDSLIKKYENTEKALDEKVANLDIVGIGDSVMLGAVGNLYKQFPNGYFDAQISRTGWVAGGILSDLKRKNMLGEVVVISLGTNGDCPDSVKENMLDIIGDRLVFWVNVTNDSDVHVNDNIKKLASNHSNVHIIDWYSESKGHSDYFVADKIHLTEKGREAFTKVIFDAIYDVYFQELQEDKDQVLGKMEESLRENYTFYGNDLLLNSLDYLEKEFDDAKYFVAKDDIKEVEDDISSDISNNVLNNNIVLLFDKESNLKVSDYKNIINLCKDKNVYIITIDTDLSSLNKIATVIDLRKDFKEEYFMVDGIHLSKEGNEVLVKSIVDKLNNK